ncbi:MAG: hypothetical protein H6Q73_940 [Firmicutes bacterium]|nr:hypothetical protein [Bacillota bacterium]
MAQQITIKIPDAVHAYLMRTGDPEEHLVTLVTQDMLMNNARNFMGIDEPKRRRRSVNNAVGDDE